MIFTETSVRGAWLVKPAPHPDERGWFARSFCELEFAEHGLATRFVQHSRSYSRRAGTIRGMHLQGAPHSEEKLVGCVAGAIHDVISDLRPHSPTYLQSFAIELSSENAMQLYIPKGVAHGFQTLVDDTVVNYLISEFYVPEFAFGYRFDDPALGIQWPLPATTISERDLNWAPLEPKADNVHSWDQLGDIFVIDRADQRVR